MRILRFCDDPERPPEHDWVYERARRMANSAMWSVAVQRRRLTTTEPEDEEFVFRAWMDFQFFLVALMRLRRTVSLAAKIPSLKADIENALRDFDTALPTLKEMRDTAEHIDDYVMNKGKNRQIMPSSLEVWVVDYPVVKWLYLELNIDAAFSAAQTLFGALQ